MKYLYANTSEGYCVHISNVEKDLKRNYCCLECGDEMIARKGNIKKHHFAHKKEECNYDKYLHTLGIIKFKDAYQKCLEDGSPFYLEYKFIKHCNYCKNKIPSFLKACVTDEGVEKFDLTQIFDLISIEPHYSEFVPDILLSSTSHKEVIFIEIAITHKCEEKKIKSGIRIIEVNIRKEEDIQLIENRNLTISEKISFFNFKVKSITGLFVNSESCEKEFHCLIINKTGKVDQKFLKMNEIHCLGLRKDLTYYEVIPDIYHFNLWRRVQQVALSGKYIKNCMTCKYLNWEDNYNEHCKMYPLPLCGYERGIDCDKFDIVK